MELTGGSQRIARGRKARYYVAHKAEIDNTAASQLQAALLGHWVRRRTGLLLAVQREASLRLQRVWRGTLSRRNSTQLAMRARESAIAIQRRWRGRMCRQQTAAAHESWGLIKGEIMIHLPHSTIKAAQALDRC